VINSLFFLIIGLGLAVPGALLLIFTVTMSFTAGDKFELNMKKLIAVYLVTLLGFAITFGVGGV
jgi:hypothetical protein